MHPKQCDKSSHHESTPSHIRSLRSTNTHPHTHWSHGRTVRLRMFSRFLRSHTCTSRSAPPVAKYREPPVKASALTSVAIEAGDDGCACVYARECTRESYEMKVKVKVNSIVHLD